MRLYESVFIARQDVSATQVENITKDLSAIIENGGGEILKHEYWGLRTLAYRIKKNRKGHYVMLTLKTDPATLAEYERIIGLNEDVLRYMSIAIDEVEEGPSIMMQAAAKPDRTGREERGAAKRTPNSAAESDTDKAKTDDVETGQSKAEDVSADKNKADDVEADESKAEDVSDDKNKADSVEADESKADDVETDANKTDDDDEAEDTDTDQDKANDAQASEEK